LLFVPQNVLGIIPDIPMDYFNTPEKLDWSIIFVTTKNDCSNNNEKALQFYSSLTQGYLNKFNFSHESFFEQCVTKDMMTPVVDKLANYGDLTIVITDYLMSVKDRHTTSSSGHYGFYKIKTIVSQAMSFSIEDKNSGWTLSHELSHFALHWKGYSNDVKREAVHQVQKQYDDCKTYDTTLTHCAYLWDAYNTPSNNWLKVMSPDYVMEVADLMNPNTYSSVIYPAFITVDSITSQPSYAKTSYISGKLFNPDTSQGIANKKLIIKAITPSGSTIVPFAPISIMMEHFQLNYNSMNLEHGKFQ